MLAAWSADPDGEGLHRLRRRFGELLQSEVAYTVAQPAEVADEIRYLLAATEI